MNRLALAVLLSSALALPAAGAHAAVVVYEAALSGPNEAPPNASPGTGFTTVRYDDVAHTLRVQVTFSGLLANTTASHIHVLSDLSQPTGPVFTQTPTFAGFPLGVQAGTYDNMFDLTQASSWNATVLNNTFAGNVGAMEAYFAQGLQQGRAYLNVHTSQFPGGEIRGFLTPAIPEPATWALLLLGFGLAGGALRRRPAAAGALAA
ncbi:MAG TPA: CHRD domain-containing protein [Croceibacterium sp.]|nr:CHRD domain-containing protein [Croceibacterium sp.]